MPLCAAFSPRTGFTVCLIFFPLTYLTSFGLYAKEEITAADGSKIPADGLMEIAFADEEGNIRFQSDLPFGTYYVKELTTDNHYKLDNTVYDVDFKYAGQEVALQSVVLNKGNAIENELKYGRITGLKVNDEVADGEEKGMAGAVFGIFREGTEEMTAENAIATATSDENGEFVFDKVPYGDYLVVELEAPEGYVRSDARYFVSVSYDEQVIGLKVINYPIIGSVELTKVDKEYPDNHLTGAVFEIYTDTDGNSELGEEDTLLGELTEYEGGIYRMDGLRYGKYLVKEKTAPEGFLLDENVYAFAVTEDGQCQIIENEAGIGFADQVMKGKISIFKTDKATGEKLVGAGFRVCDPDGNVVAEGKTGEDGMKEYFGNVDHLRATVSEVPVPDADYRKQYLVIYDSVPGGTGYLKQLMHEKNALIEIFEKALSVMENCSCKDDDQKDGCYHCLYAYRQSQQIGNISRATAMRILKSILSGKDNIQKIDKINDIPVNPLFDSELEQRFMEAIRTKVGAANVTDSIRNGKHCYYVKLDDFAWEIEPQVLLDAGSGVSVACKPDFVFWPVSAPEHKPIAVFTDGFLYHKDSVADDTIKREAIRRSRNFHVWSLSFKDVQNVFASQGDFYTATLEAEKMPSGKLMYQNMIKKQKADALEPVKLSSFDLLLAYLKMSEAEKVFKGQAYAYSLSLLDPSLMKNSLAFNNWKQTIDTVNEQTHFTDTNFVFPGTVYGTWIPRSVNTHLTIYSGIAAVSLKNEGAVAVCAVLNDEKDCRTDKYEQEWNGFWRFCNLMQFLEEFIAVCSTGISRMDYLALPAIVNSVSNAVPDAIAVDNAWDAVKDLLFDDDARAFVDLAKDAGFPAPNEDSIGYEVEGNDGEVVATVEIAWPDKCIGFMTVEQSQDKQKLEDLGWKILNLLEVTDIDAVSLFGGDK